MALLADGAMSINVFENWIDPFVWDIERSPSDAVDLVYSLQLLFADRDNRHVKADDLKREIIVLLNNVNESVSIENALASASTMSASRPFVINEPRRVWLEPAAA